MQLAGVQAARRMISDGASCIADASSSAVSIATFKSATEPEGVLQISPASTSDEITGLDDPDGLMNRTAPPDSLQGPTLANYIEQELGAPRASRSTWARAMTPTGPASPIRSEPPGRTRVARSARR